MSLKKEINKLLENRSFAMGIFISALVAGIGIFMLVLNLVLKNYVVIPITIAYTVLMGITLIALFLTKKTGIFYFNAILLIFLLEITFLLNGGSEGFGILWISMVPIFAVYILSFDYYVILNIIVFLVLILGLWTPLNQFCYDFNGAFEIRYPILYFIEGFFGLFLKKRISRTEDNLAKQNALLGRELEQAAIIQENFYNHAEKDYEGWDLAHVLKPMAAVTGDLYDIYDRNNNLNGIGIFDISGHGISSGLVTMLVKNIIQQEFYAGENDTLSQVVELIDGRVVDEKGEIDNYLTGILVRIKESNLELVNAGHPYPVIYRKKTDSFEVFKKDPASRGAIGFSDLSPVFISQNIEMEPGDELIVFTDGIFDIKNEEGKSFTMDDFTRILWDSVELSSNVQIEHLMKKIEEFRGEVEQTDDLTVLILKKAD